MRRKTMTKKMSALRGPKLFGKVMPREHNATCTVWRAGVYTAVVRDIGSSWSADWGGGYSRGYATRAAAKTGLERAIRESGKRSLALGWEPKR